jgi:hypothetical protein
MAGESSGIGDVDAKLGAIESLGDIPHLDAAFNRRPSGIYLCGCRAVNRGCAASPESRSSHRYRKNANSGVSTGGMGDRYRVSGLSIPLFFAYEGMCHKSIHRLL